LTGALGPGDDATLRPVVDLPATLPAPRREGVTARRDDPAATPTADTLAATDTLLGTLPIAPTATRAELDIGAHVGRYLVIRRLGAGAMGVVYAAYDPKLDRKVALKLLVGAAAEGTEGARQRLEREAQALAQLAHPNVVGVHDVDRHDGRLYVAMEFVAGRTLGAWMREAPRPWRTVLDVFLAAGRGLAAAHAAGLIHRDFKPENAMVGDDGRVRVMDFGLARPTDALPGLEDLRASLSEDLGPRTLDSPMTLSGTAMGTPAYMALEQFEGKADARSDQFNFCVALYEGLYGERPFAADSLAGLLAALRSGAVKRPPRGAAVPTWLRAALLRGLAPDPGQRWPTMDALLAALAADPARRRRRWIAVALGATLVAGLAGGVGWYAQQQARACTGFAARLDGIWDDAARARTRAAFAATGLVYAEDSWRRAAERLDDHTRRWVAARQDACEATRRGEQSGALLDLRMACLNERLRHVEATVALLAAPDADITRNAVEAVTRLPRLERCADPDALAAEQPPPEDAALAARVAALGEQLIAATALRNTGKYARGLEAAGAVVTAAAALPYEPLQARAWLLQGALQADSGAHADAEATLERAYTAALGLRMLPEAAEAARHLVFIVGDRLARPADGRRWATHAGPLTRAARLPEAEGPLRDGLGTLAYREGRLDEARVHHERALAIAEAARGPDHPALALTLTNLGIVALAEGRLDRSRAHHERALAIAEAALGPDHPDLATPLTALGIVAQTEGRPDQARAHHERALAISERALGPDHPDLATTLTALGALAQDEGRLDLARAHLERALAIGERSLPPGHPDRAVPLISLGLLALQEGAREQARGLLERALAHWERVLGPDHLNLAIPLTNLGIIALEDGAIDQARAHLTRALDLTERALGPDHPKLADPLNNLGEVAQRAGQLAQARGFYERALTLRERALGPEHPDLAIPLVNLGDVALKEARPEQARAHHERALTLWERALGPEHPNLAYPLTGLGRARLALGAPADALAPLERALGLRDAHPGDPAEHAMTRLALARALWDAPADAGRDRPRAHALAELAAQAHLAAGAADRLAEVRAWQSTHRR